MIVFNDIIKKHYEIEDIVFDVAVDRELAVKAFQHEPKYFEFIQKQQNLINSANEGNEQDLVETLNLLEVVPLMRNIVIYALPLMLEKANCVLPEDNNSYEDFAEKIIQYSIDNDIFDDYYLIEDEQTIHQGLCSSIIDLLQQGFTKGVSPKTAKKVIRIM